MKKGQIQSERGVGVGLCECGCGKPTNLAKRNDPYYGIVKGKPRRYIRGHTRNRIVDDVPAYLTGEDRRLYRQYGMTVADYDVMSARQQHKCAICRHPERTFKKLAVDHDRVTGEIRGLLCHLCNRAIGHLMEDIVVVRRMLAYLESFAAARIKSIPPL